MGMDTMNNMGGDASFTGNDMEEPIDDENIEMGANAFGDENENEVTDDPPIFMVLCKNKG